MKKNLPVFLLGSGLLFLACYFLYKPLSDKDVRAASRLQRGPSFVEPEDRTDEIAKAMEQEIELTRDPRTREVPVERLITAAKLRDQRFAASRRGSMGTMSAVPGISWTERGPNNIGGRTRALMYDLNDAPNFKKVWAGAVGGGLWVTSDITAASPNWTKINDLFDNIAITSLAQDPTNHNNLFFGTGEGWFNSDAIRGLGIWASTDGGTTWAQLSATNNSNFYYVQKVFVNSTGVLFACTRAGLQRSTDGGASWTKVLGSGVGASSNNIADIEEGANGYLYCSVGIGNNDGIYRSTDAGVTWDKVYSSSSTEQRIELAPAPTQADSVYALVQSSSQSIKYIMLTDNATDATAANVNWMTFTNPTWCDGGSSSNDFTRGQAWYDLIAAVNPSNSASFTIGGVDMLQSNDAGISFNQISQWASGCGSLPYVHADIHAIQYKPGSSTEFLVGCDGGVFRTTDNGASFAQRNGDYNVTQYYSCAIHPTTNNYFLAGAQDNGTHLLNTGGIGAGTAVTGGDGGFCHIDQNTGQVQFTAYTSNDVSISTDGGTSFNYIPLGGGSFINPSDYDDREDVFYSANSTNTYKRWNHPSQPNGSYQSVTVSQFGNKVTHVAVSPQTPNRVYFGTANGRVVRVDDANTGTSKTGTILFSQPLGAAVSCIAIDPSNEDHMLVTYYAYGITSVYESVNATAASPSFSSVEGNLPDMPVRWAMFDPRNSDWALLATELGVWSTDDLNAAGTTDWQPTNSGFANVRVDMLQYRPSDGTLAAASHGRGLFTATVPLAPSIYFSQTGAHDKESSTSGSVDCRGYKDYSIPLAITSAPSGDATVTISVATQSTATEGVDFDYTTDGNFSTPNHVLSFPSGATAPQSFTLRVYNDDEVENEEGIVFNIAVSGSTDAVKSIYNSYYSFAIVNNDLDPVGSANTSATIGVGSTTSYFTGISSSSITNNRARIQMMYLASELQDAGLQAGTISGMQFTVQQKNSSGAYNNFTISMANSASANLNGGFSSTGFTQVYSNNLTTAAGNNSIAFSSNFVWDGTSNIIVQFCYDNGATAISTDYVQATSLLDKDYYVLARAQTAAGTACSLSAQYGFNERMDISFTISNPTSIETTLNAGQTASVLSGKTYNFYSSPDNKLLVQIANPDLDLACVTVDVDEAGNTWQSFAGGERSQKVFLVTPSSGSGANYSITLYYTTAELAGKDPATLRLLKTSASSADAATAGNSTIVTPTVTDYGTYQAFTASFTGFSRFFLIDNAALPLVLKDFTGKLESDQHSGLHWTTSSESNTSHFEVERSIDAVHFEMIGRVSAAGSSSNDIKYSLRDPYIAEPVNYYRLKMVDRDGRSRYSEVLLIKNPQRSLQAVRVLSNPFGNQIELLFSQIPSQRVRFILRDMNGRTYYNKELQISSNRWMLDVSRLTLSQGSYVLEVNTGGEKKSFLIVKRE